MPKLDNRGIIAAATIGFYIPPAILTLFLLIRYALRRDAGWLWLFIFSLCTLIKTLPWLCVAIPPSSSNSRWCSARGCWNARNKHWFIHCIIYHPICCTFLLDVIYPWFPWDGVSSTSVSAGEITSMLNSTSSADFEPSAIILGSSVIWES